MPMMQRLPPFAHRDLKHPNELAMHMILQESVWRLLDNGNPENEEKDAWAKDDRVF
jgi:hypothetical protein